MVYKILDACAFIGIGAVITFSAPIICYADPTPPEPTIEKSIPARVLNEPEDKIWTMVVENDLFGSGLDKNYTSGVRLNYTDTRPKFPAIAHKIDRFIPTFEINDTSSIYYSFGQSIYTPADITQSSVNLNDRPWAAFLYASMGMATLTDNHTDEVEATIGIVGPAALGEQTQKLIHRILPNNKEPQGWSHQLKNEPGLMLAWQRGWPMLAKTHIGGTFLSFDPYMGATVGNIRTYGDVGFTVRLSPADSIWQDTPVRVRPAMPGTGIYEIPSNKWSWNVFAGIEGRAIARDIFLDGNTFADSHSIDKNAFVMDTNAGVALTYKNTRLSYTVVYRTREFETQDRPEIFGALSLGVRF